MAGVFIMDVLPEESVNILKIYVMNFEEKINYYKESLDLFDDGMEKYKFLIDQAKNAKNFPEDF